MLSIPPLAVSDQPYLGDATPLQARGGMPTPVDLLIARVTALEIRLTQTQTRLCALEDLVAVLARPPWWRRWWTAVREWFE